MNGPTRKKWYNYLVKRDGEKCKFCGAVSQKRSLVIDHKDNNNSHNNPDNLQLVCRRCNYLKNPRPVDLCVNESEVPTEIQINRTKEPEFKRLIAQFINENGMWEENDLINSVAERLGLSPVTIKRYLDKVCSSEGIYQKVMMKGKRVITYKAELEFA